MHFSVNLTINTFMKTEGFQGIDVVCGERRDLELALKRGIIAVFSLPVEQNVFISIDIVPRALPQN